MLAIPVSSSICTRSGLKSGRLMFIVPRSLTDVASTPFGTVHNSPNRVVPATAVGALTVTSMASIDS